MRKLFKNAKIYDGSGDEAYIGDVLIDQDRILAVEKSIDCEMAEVIDCQNLSISAGFFDAHSHNDWFAIKEKPIKYFEPFVRQGITSFIAGNCGLSATGFAEDSPNIDKVGAGLFFFKDTIGRFGTVAEFFKAIDGNTPLNIATLIGHCSARTSVAGYENRQLNAEESENMKAILEQGLKDGACGISLGLMYEPGIYASTEELREVAKLCEKYDRPLTAHPRACSAVSMSYSLGGRPHLLRALDELVEVTKGLKVKFQYSHAIFVGAKSFECCDELVSIIEKMRADGVDAMFDIYSEECGVSVITVIMPAWYQAMTAQEKKKKWNKIKFKVLAAVTKKLLGFGFEDIQVAFIGEGFEKYEGKRVSEIAEEIKKSDYETYIQLCDESGYKGRVNMYKYSTPEIISKLSKHPNVLYMTDAWVEDFGTQNTAIYDCFPKFLYLALNGKGDTMENTVRKMTGAVADRFSIPERGYLKAGYFADITIFDEKELKTAEVDKQRSYGIKSVFVNGKQVLADGKLNQKVFAKAGRAMPSKN